MQTHAPESEPNRRIKFKYIFAKDYNPVYVTGAHGGVTPRGEIVVNFFLERQPLPHHVINEVTAEGKIGELVEIAPEDNKSTIVRFVQVGVLLDLKGAAAIVDFLEKHIKLHGQHFGPQKQESGEAQTE